jgi:hypothetical protein
MRHNSGDEGNDRRKTDVRSSADFILQGSTSTSLWNLTVDSTVVRSVRAKKSLVLGTYYLVVGLFLSLRWQENVYVDGPATSKPLVYDWAA